MIREANAQDAKPNVCDVKVSFNQEGDQYCTLAKKGIMTDSQEIPYCPSVWSLSPNDVKFEVDRKQSFPAEIFFSSSADISTRFPANEDEHTCKYRQ